MTHHRAPLIARLRRRLAATTWLLAFLVLAKASFATACLTDGLSVDASTVVSTLVDQTRATLPLDDDGGACWHAGAGGCHCSCVHASALAPANWQVAARRPAQLLVVASPAAAASAARDDALRPPIA